ncbi:MAG: tandem-95 repeat protein, partial [bacterium]
VDDAATTAEETAVTVSVLANDTDESIASLIIQSYTQGSHGFVVKSGTGLRYTPYTNYHGADSFTYVVKNAGGDVLTATVAITVTPVNDAPIARDDLATTAQDNAVTINVVVNDTDADGDDLIIISFRSLPDHGTVVIDTENNMVVYTPDAGWYGQDSFAYRIEDAAGVTDTATVTVNVSQAID